MTKLLSALLASGMMNALLPTAAGAQEEPTQGWSDLGIGEPDQTPPPATTPPAELPPAPQYQPQYESAPVQAEEPPAPAPQAQPAPAAPAAGQWIYTQQYGWIWMPYGDAYTYAPPSGSGEPVAYVYYPAYSCWAWVAAPWVWGIGPWPFFGAFGPVHYAWYGHGWWRSPGRWHYAPFRGAFAGFRPSPFRGGFARPAPARGGFVRPAPAFRGGAGFSRPAPAFRGGVSHGFAAGAPMARGGFAAPRGGGFAAPRGGGFAAPRSGFTAPRGGFAPRAAAPSFGGRGGFSGGHGGGAVSRGGFSSGHGGGGGGHGRRG